jgi:hypothetical protein
MAQGGANVRRLGKGLIESHIHTKSTPFRGALLLTKKFFAEAEKTLDILLSL